MDDKIQSYRQPMVTATSLLLGFTLNTSANWVAKAFSTDRIAEIILGISLCLHIPLFILVLYRILNMNYPRDKANAYYKKTLIYFIAGIAISFMSILIILVESFMIHKQ
jgi:hypothetical protein